MDDENWDPRPPHGVNQGYDRYPGYDRVSGYGERPRQAPPPGYSRTAASPGYDFRTISNNPAYQQGYGYQPPYGMEPVIDDEGAKGMGTASMVLGIVSLGITFLGFGFYGLCSVISLITSIVGVSLGAVSLKKYNRTGATDGKGMAVAGVVMNIINLAISVFVILIFIVIFFIWGMMFGAGFY